MKAHRETPTLGHWLLQRTTAAFSVPTILIANVSTLILLNILLFWHIHVGIEEILADHVHHEVTRNWILILLRIFLLVIIKDVFVFFVRASGALSITNICPRTKALIQPSIPVHSFQFCGGHYLSTSSRFILTNKDVSRGGHKFSETLLKRSFSTGGPVQPSMLAKMKALIWQIWTVRLWFFKLYMHAFLRVYWILMHSTFGKITFVPFFWISVLISEEYPFLGIFYLYVFSTSLSLFIVCRVFPPFHGWLEDTFGKDRLTQWVGNSPFNAVKRHGVGIAAYFVMRSADNLINDYRVERKAGAMVEHLEKSGNSFEKNPAELERIWDKAEKSVGPSLTKKLETGVSEAVKGALKGVFNDPTKD